MRALSLVLAFLLASSAAAGLVPVIGEPVAPPAPEPAFCPERITEVTGAPTDSVSEARLVGHDVVHNVEADTNLTLAIVALAAALHERPDFANLTNFTEDTRDTCMLSLRDTPGENLSRLAQQLHIARLPANASVSLELSTHHEHRVSLGTQTALAALAMAGAGMPPRLDEVLSVEDHSWTNLTRSQVVQLDDDAPAPEPAPVEPLPATPAPVAPHPLPVPTPPTPPPPPPKRATAPTPPAAAEPTPATPTNDNGLASLLGGI